MGRVDGKVALITGAARGQGRSHALRLAEEGAGLIAIDLCSDIESVPYGLGTVEELMDTVVQVEAQGGRIFAAQADVRNLDSLTASVDAGVAQMGGLDIVCGNAGIFSFGPSHILEEETWNDVIDVNLTGVWNTCRAAIPHLLERGRGGSIILTSSAAGLRGTANAAHYTAAKHGVIGLMRTLAIELAPYMIRVNTINPTSVDTPMIHNRGTYKLFRPDLNAPTLDDAKEGFQSINALPIPWVESIDISNAVLFLASDEARYITGVTLPVDAGRMVL